MMRRELYPENWRDISLRIREREGNCCKMCGVKNGTYIMRSTVDPERYLILGEDLIWRTQEGEAVRISEIPVEFGEQKFIKVVLTVHHIDFDKSNNREDNLVALCNRCHLIADMPLHIENAKKTRARKKREKLLALGQLELAF